MLFGTLLIKRGAVLAVSEPGLLLLEALGDDEFFKSSSDDEEPWRVFFTTASLCEDTESLAFEEVEVGEEIPPATDVTDLDFGGALMLTGEGG